jgi:hypothetical protein
MRQIALSDQTYQRLLSRINSFDDTPETVINRVLDEAELGPSAATKLKSRPADGELLAESAYWLPILSILVEWGGKARGRDVIDALEEPLRSSFGPADEDILEMGEVRWRNRARFARLRMKELGLIDNESPRGVWEITEKGREFLRTEGDRANSEIR